MSHCETCCFDGVARLFIFGNVLDQVRYGTFESYFVERKKDTQGFFAQNSYRKLTLLLNSDILLTRNDLHILIDGRGFEKQGDLDKLIKLVYKLITLVFVLAGLDAEKKRTGKRGHDEDNSF
jgi:hypothetical protein